MEDCIRSTSSCVGVTMCEMCAAVSMLRCARLFRGYDGRDVYVCVDVAMCGCYLVWMLPCVDVTIFGCYHVWMLPCVNVTMYGCYDVWMLRCLDVSLCGRVCVDVTMGGCVRLDVAIYELCVDVYDGHGCYDVTTGRML
jgi:hypothetical protein